MLRRFSVLLVCLAIAWATLAIAATKKKSVPSTSTRTATLRPNSGSGRDVAQPEPDPTASTSVTTNAATPTNIEVGGREVLNPEWPSDQPYEFPAAGVPLGGTQGSASAPINMNWYSVNNGGATEVAAGNIKLGVSVGQNAVGEVAAGNVKLGLGFWYGAGSGAASPCVCQCAHDPQCDGHPDIIDVSLCINVAFRDGAPITDPSGTCPWKSTDVDCSSATDILDVTKMINVAFRDGSPAVNFCNPCP